MPIVDIDDRSIEGAAAVIRRGGLVAFPTETVYGLGANALDPDAVARIFAAKGRPATNPLIVHVVSLDAAAEIAYVNEAARRLASAFWPGPITFVLPRRADIPDIVTAGGPTVAVRQPRHPVAQRLLEACGLPIAAPSANRSESISPTRAQHVLASLGDAVDIILDGGPTEVGLESTVVDLTVDPPRLLRPGMISAPEIANVLGIWIASAVEGHGIARSPGLMPRHYAPQTPLRLCHDVWAARRSSTGPVAVIARTVPEGESGELVWVLGDNPIDYAARLYDTLHTVDAAGAREILVESVPDTEPWRAIRDRLIRASAR